MPTHWARIWLSDGGFFVKRDISLLREEGFSIPLGHGGQDCPHISSQHSGKTSEDNNITFQLIDYNGVHNTRLHFCTCLGSPDRMDQLLNFGFFPATTKRPTMAFSFTVLHQFHILNLESKASAYDFIGTLRRMTDNVFSRDTSDPYQQFLIVMRFWRILMAKEHLGQAHGIDILTPRRPQGNLLVFCPSCPEPGINMEPQWEETPMHLRHLNHTLLTLDGNFHLNRYKKNSSSDDYSLYSGHSYYPKDSEFKAYLRSLPAKDIDDKIDCPIKAVKSQNKSGDNLSETGVLNVQCSHVIVRSTVDLQRGERFANTDYAVKCAIEQNKDPNSGKPFVNPAGIMLSYDMSCAYNVHMSSRFTERFPHIASVVEKITPLIPLVHVNNHKENCVYEYSCSYVPNAGHFHGETAEHEWAELNQVATQTRQMNNGHRQDVLIDHHSDWNWKKVANMAVTLSSEIVRDRNLFIQKREQFLSLVAVFATRVPIWNLEDRNHRQMNSARQIECVFRHRRAKVPTQATLFQALLDSAEPVEEASPSIRRSLSATVLNEALYIENEQRRITKMLSQSDEAPTEVQRLRAKLRNRIDAWRARQEELLGQVMASLQSLRDDNDVSAIDKPEHDPLYFPSDLSSDQREIYKLGALAIIEVTLREGRLYDTIRSIQDARKIGDGLYHNKKTTRGQTQKTRATARIEALDRTIDLLIEDYNASQVALVRLGGKTYPVMTVADTYRKSTHSRREIGDSGKNHGRIYNTGVNAGISAKSITSSGLEPATGNAAHVSTQGVKAKPRIDKKLTKSGKGRNRRLETNSDQTSATNTSMVDIQSKPKPDGWIWELKDMQNLSSYELQEWSDECDRVQYFRAEAEMQRWQEEHETKQAQFMRCIRSFKAMSDIWLQLATMVTNSPGHVAHARKTAAIYSKMEHDAVQRFGSAGYKHRIDSMNSENPPLLAELIEKDREALKEESVTVDSLLSFP
ncbi:hypothetical protein BDN70DRAFT_939041 [Pholiota conissans]|uniref:CxC2-like cysteine cluster KDZ transposase-associated domain-containing protein n=1 Tax=Pholiota conissans TaxID=109636 RepID=A0A9P5YP06_9AGAR|nr:hypothetical protein BDN70DRAFT_939041 [Pholiota conissans]